MHEFNDLLKTIILIIGLITLYHFVVLPCLAKIKRWTKRRQVRQLQIIRPEFRQETIKEQERKVQERRKQMKIIKWA